MNTKSVLAGIMMAFLIISLAQYIVNGIVAIRDALVNSGLLSGSISTTYIKKIGINDVKKNLTSHGITNSTNTKVYIRDAGNQYIITIMKKQTNIIKLEDKEKNIETWSIDKQFTVPKTKAITVTSTYDFTAFVQILSAIIAVFLLIVVAEKLGIRL